ncbi:MAG: hypothetical protein ABSG67_05095, partial [Thermoguttaceae bacterium]
NAVAWMLLGVLPTLWMAAYGEYLFVVAAGRNYPPNLLTRWCEPMASLIVEPYVRLSYPYQYEGERFVMWSDSPEYDDKQMAAMDAHLRAMEESLGLQSCYKANWVRGKVWGMGGRGCMFGWVLGSPSSTPAGEASGWNYLDRHEVSHFVLDHFCSGLNVPMLLHEGWAELHSPPKPESHWRDRWIVQRDGTLPSLRELTAPEWYHNSIRPMYWEGSVLVEYILKRFGHEKFRELCSTCCEATFPDDVERVLGVSLDELDSAYQHDLAEREPPYKQFLMSAKLAKEVDPAQWRRFVDDYCVGVERILRPFRQASVTTLLRFDDMLEKGKMRTSRDRYRYYRGGQRQARAWGFPECTAIDVTTPEADFFLNKDTGEKSWRLAYSARNRRLDHERTAGTTKGLDFLDIPLEPLHWQSDAKGITITGIRADALDSHLVRISYEETFARDNREARQQGWLDFDPQRDYGLVEGRFEDFDDKQTPAASWHATVQYETIDGKHVPKRVCSETLCANGELHRRTIEIETCQFGSPPANVFELTSYGDFRVPEPPADSSAHVGILTWIASGFTLLTLLLACPTLKSVRCR